MLDRVEDLGVYRRHACDRSCYSECKLGSPVNLHLRCGTSGVIWRSLNAADETWTFVGEKRRNLTEEEYRTAGGQLALQDRSILLDQSLLHVRPAITELHCMNVRGASQDRFIDPLVTR